MQLLLHIDNIQDKFSNAKYFSTLDLASGTWHGPIHPLNAEKLAFETNSGLFELNI